MLSKQVADREASDRVVAAAFSTHGAKAAAVAAGRLTPLLEPGETAPDVSFLVVLLGRLLARSSAAMTLADQAHTSELGDDAAKRDERDAITSSVTGLVTSIRLALTERFGSDFGGRLGPAGTAPRVPGDVLSWGGNVLAALSAVAVPADDLGADDNDVVAAFSKEDAVKKLTRRLTALETAINKVASEDREAEATLVAKGLAITTHDADFAFAARFLETLLEGAGEHELAGRVRPSTRRPGQTTDRANEPTTPTPPAPTPPEPVRTPS